MTRNKLSRRELLSTGAKASLLPMVPASILTASKSPHENTRTATYDLLVTNTRIVDGSGGEPYIGNVAVMGDRIVAVGETGVEAATVIDAGGRVTCPGFIDPHSHADMGLLGHPAAENLVMQGITTFVGGNCGMSLAPVRKRTYIDLLSQRSGQEIPVEWETFDDWLSKVEEVGTALNYVPMVGHHAIRGSVLDSDFKREATAAEIEEMKELVDEAMHAGAHGMSSFADPSIGEYASTEEMVELTRVAGSHGGFSMPHTRHIQSQWWSADPEEYGYGIFHGPAEDAWVGRYRGYLEAIEIGRRADTPVHIAHYSTAFQIPQPHPDELDAAAARATLQIIDDAMADGADVTFDVIPCTSSISGRVPLIGAFSRWLDGSGSQGLVERMKTKAFRAELHRVYEQGRLKVCMIHTKADPYWMNRLKILHCANPEYEGKTVSEITTAMGCHPLDTLIDLVIEDPETMWVQFQDARQMPAATPVYLHHPKAMPCTDAVYVLPIAATDVAERPTYGVSPIMFGLYAHYFETYVREQGVLSLEEAVKKATSWPAERFGIIDRGVLRRGAFADIVVFDPDTIRMTGDFDNPAQAPEGIKLTVVNGKVVYDGNAHTGALPGKVLRRT